MKEIVLKITGRVQGVSFRYYTRKKATELGLVGFVKNKNDGSVLVLAQGKKEALKKFINWCKEGPEMARVDQVDSKWKDPEKEFGQFMIRK